MLRWTVHLKEGGPEGNNAAVEVLHKVYCFGGGSVNRAFLDIEIEVHIFNTVSLRWTKLPPVTTGRGERPLEVPSMCWGHTAVLIEDVIYIWGGLKYKGEHCNMLYAFDVDTHRWFKPNVSGTVPKARYLHSACVLGKVMYLYGGFTMPNRHNDIYTLDTITMVWSLTSGGTQAPVSSWHSATIIGTKMFVFGGRRDEDHYNNINVFDTETNCWLSTPSSQIFPEERKGHSAFAYNGELYIFGGSTLLLTFNDLWKFNPETFTWKNIEPKGKGPRRTYRMYRMCCCMVGDHILLFGGYERSVLYILDLSPSLKTLCKLAVIRYDLEQQGLPHGTRWELAAMSTTN